MDLEVLKNGLNCSIDYIGFTFDVGISLYTVIDILGFTYYEFDQLEHGSFGYKSAIKFENITLLYEGNSEMGVHLNVTGSSVSVLFDRYKNTLLTDTPFGSAYNVSNYDNVLQSFFSKLLGKGHFTRIDIAVDDYGCNYFSVDDVVSLFEEKRIVSKFRIFEHTYSKSSCDYTTNGNTAYFGSRRSDIFLRVYDKKLENNQKLLKADKPVDNTEWVRWELELKDDYANIVAANLLNKNIGAVGIGILSSYFRVIDLDYPSNRSRCSVNSVWSSFVNNTEKLRLFVPMPDTTIEDKKRWIDKQVAPTLYAIFENEGGSIDYMYDVLKKGALRMNGKLRRLVDTE